jgi:hypothetical protein
MMEPTQESVYLLDWAQFTFYWDGISKCLDETDFGTYYTKEWLMEQVRLGYIQVWALSDGMIRLMIFSRIFEYPKAKVIQIFWGYGCDLDKFLEVANSAMDKAAAAIGADRIEIFGRPGWARKMKKLGFEREWYVIGRPIEKRTEQ